MARSTVCLALVAVLVGNAAAMEITPIQKVVQLMSAMLAKGDAEKKDEAVKFSAFSTWCDNQNKNKQGEIQRSTDAIAAQNAAIEKAASHIRALTGRVQELEEDVGRWQKDQKSTAAVRERERLDFTATQLDYAESLDALGQAITVMKGVSKDKPQAELVQETLLQVANKALVPLAIKSALGSFLQQGASQPDADMPDDQLFIKAPEANAYDFQSSGVVDMLEKLKDEFVAKKTDLETEELTAQNGFELMSQTLADNIENAEHEVSKKTKLRAETAQSKADTEGELAQTTADRDEDQKYLSDQTALCQQKTSDFESRQKLRGEEIAAISQALDLIQSGAVAGSGDKHLPALMQMRAKRSAFAQLRSDVKSPIQDRISAFLSERARRTGSHLLAEVSARVAANPFVKVKRMIHDLIIKLQEEGTSETEHKGWCDTELTTNKQTRDRKTADVADLNANIEDLTAEIAGLTQDIADLAAGIKALDDAMATATDERMASKEKNGQTVDEAKAAQTAVEQAIALLKDFYAKSAQATALTQQAPAEDAPETFDKPYKGLLPEGGNIVDFLEVILSDFARLESETAASEATEDDEYKTYMFESKKDKALKENSQGHKGSKKVDQEGALHSSQEELKATSEELDKAIAYYDKLKPTCVDSGISYEERVKRREEEMQSLQEALQILTGSDIA